MLPSLQEAARLQRLIPGARRIILADSGHTALLEVRAAYQFGSLVHGCGMCNLRAYSMQAHKCSSSAMLADKMHLDLIACCSILLANQGLPGELSPLSFQS